MHFSLKVAHLTSVHSRFDTRIFLKECTSLVQSGYSVSLIVADGKGDETKSNVSIYDVGASKGRLDRILNASGRVLVKALELGADIYHFHDPELIPIGLKLKRLGKKVIFDIHENTDLQILTKEWIPIFLRKTISYMYFKYEIFACRKFDALVVPQYAMKKKYSYYATTELIANFPSESMGNISRDNLCKYKLLYSGGLSEPRGLFNMLNLVARLVEIDPQYHLTLAGPISAADLNKARKHPGWKNTTYLGVLSKERIYEEYMTHSIGLIMFNNVGQYYMAYSLKLFEYMQCGMTVVMPDFGDWIDFNRINSVGLNIDTKSLSESTVLIDNISNDQLRDFSERNVELALSKFMWSSQKDSLIKLYEELISEY